MQALESPHVRQNLCHWIDLVFGFKQTGKEAVEAVNVFHPATYSTNQTQTLDTEVEERARQTMIETYGQTPLQLFTSPHPLPLADLVSDDQSGAVSAVSSITGLSFGSYVGAPGQPSPTVVWQQSQGVIVTSLVRLETNEIIGLASRTLLTGHYNTGRSLGRISSGLQLVDSCLVTWGHVDHHLHCHAPGEQDDHQVGGGVLSWDQVVTGASHPRVSSVWLGHRSGLVSVHNIVSSLKLSPPQYLHAHTSSVSSLALCPEFSIAVSASSDNTLVTWDLHSHTFLHTINLASSAPTLLVTISGTSGDIAACCDKTLTLLTINLEMICQTKVEDSKISAVTMSNEEEGVSINCVAVGLQSGLVKMYSSLDLKYLRDLIGAPANSPVLSLVHSQDSQNLAVSSADGTVTIFEKFGHKGLNKTPKFATLQ